MDRFGISPTLLHGICNLSCTSYFLYLSYLIVQIPLDARTPLDIALGISYWIVAIVLLFRPAAQVGRYDLKTTAVCLGSSLYYLLFDLNGPFEFQRVAVGELVIAVGVIGWMITAAFLGRSFSILPSRRRIRTEGPYRLVRHPMYACYLLIDMGLLLCFTSIWNSLVVLSAAALYVARALMEEQILAGEPAYNRYLQRTRFRFLPFFW